MVQRSSSPLVDCRLAAGFTQEDLAEKVRVDRTTVGRWERGVQMPQPWLRPALARILGVSLERLDDVLRGTMRRGLDGHESTNQAEVLSGDVAPANANCQGRGNLQPDGLLQDARDAARFARQASSTIINPSALDQISAEVHNFAADYVSQPLVGLLASIRELRSEVFRLVDASRSPCQMRDLYFEASRLAGLEAHACLDLGHYRASSAHAQAALVCAEMAGHDGMRAWVRGLQSLIAYWDGDLDDAVKYAQAGALYAVPGSIGARLASLEARACAARGDKAGALAALGQAERVRDLVRDDHDEVGLFTFPAAKQAVYAGTTLLAMKDRDMAARAAKESSRALAFYESAAPADRSSGDILAARLDLGRAHLQRGDLDGLAEHLRVVLAVPPMRRTASIVKRADRITASLRAPQYVACGQAQQIRAEIRSFCAPPPTLSSA